MIKKFDFSRYKDCLRDKAFDSGNATRAALGSRDDDHAYYSVMDPFLLDVEKIRNSKAYRRLFFKTQVFPFPDSVYIRNRGFHTGEVVSSGTRLASITGLNIGLVQAGSFGHDLGQVPFGHLGESFMSEKLSLEFLHAIYSVIVCRKIERSGRGLNLCLQTEQAIAHHSRTRDKGQLLIAGNAPQEETLVMYCDKIGYTFSDINDAVAVGLLNEKTLIKEIKLLGKNQRERVMACEYALIEESAKLGYVSFAKSEVAEIFAAIRDFMFDNVYLALNETEEHKKMRSYLDVVYNGFIDSGLNKVQTLTIISIMTDVDVKSFAAIFNKDSKKVNLNFIKTLMPIDIFVFPVFTNEMDFITI
ncbi:MAG: HD domain-containing protein [Candidatus Falkowbacteria bacterium]